jgi:hypothetical protein
MKANSSYLLILTVLTGLIAIGGCGSEPATKQSQEEIRQQQVQGARRMEQEAGR